MRKFFVQTPETATLKYITEEKYYIIAKFPLHNHPNTSQCDHFKGMEYMNTDINTKTLHNTENRYSSTVLSSMSVTNNI
jgi:hypothetical protein